MEIQNYENYHHIHNEKESYFVLKFRKRNRYIIGMVIKYQD